MTKIILVDGNNLLFRSYYATAYNGNFMKNSKGFPTNALFGFTNMINKIVLEEKPNYMIVAFDKGKTFRHDKYESYKDGRIAMPEELKLQFPKAKELLEAMGIKSYEIDNYEADDIIGTFAKYCDKKDDDYQGLIISSDKDLLQLISDEVEIKLLKQKDYIRYNLESFKAEYGIEPKNIVDLKALMGDSSDNIPGVKGVGEKTALKLLQEYKSLDNIYLNIDKIKGSLHDKLVNDKENAYMSYDLATIYREVPLEINLEDIKYLGNNSSKLNKVYEELEFSSFIRKSDEVEVHKEVEVNIVKDVNEIAPGNYAIYIENDNTNYHKANPIGISLYNDSNSYFVPFDLFKNIDFKGELYTYDIKKLYVTTKRFGIELNTLTFDTMLAAYLLDYTVKDDVAYLAREFDYDVDFYENIMKKEDINLIAYNAITKAKFIYETRNMFINKLKNEELYDLYNNIEIPLTYVLGDMEYSGVNIDLDILGQMGDKISKRITEITSSIYDLVGMEFNVSSTKELGVILFERLNLPHGKKGKTGYSTAIDVLEKLRPHHPVIDLIIEYRMLTKLHSTYIEGLSKIAINNKIHTIYNQALTRTGRLSSVEPNLQNIPIRNEVGKLIRTAFIPSEDSVIISADYSQIELRILAHMANVTSLIDAFNSGKDIHSKTASDIFHKDINDITSRERRIAKAVNFGIIYGISGFGLSENLDISVKDAQNFINEYLETYPGIKEYMDKTIKRAYELGYVKTLLNRKRNIFELKNTNHMIKKQGERIALNTPIQGTSADIIKKAMIEIHEEMKKRGMKSKMIIQVHDELVFDAKNNEVEELTNLIENIMENTFKMNVPLKVDINIGTDWYNVK